MPMTSFLDISRLSLQDMRPGGDTSSGKRRRQRLRQSQRRYWSNTIGEDANTTWDRSRSMITLSDDSSDEEAPNQEEEDETAESASVRPGPSGSSSQQSFASRLEDMAAKLDALVRHIQRNVEASNPAGSEATFSILSFMLEDWDR